MYIPIIDKSYISIVHETLLDHYIVYSIIRIKIYYKTKKVKNILSKITFYYINNLMNFFLYSHNCH